MKKNQASAPQIRDRIRELRRVQASELLPNPKNWRRHPAQQAAAMAGMLAEVGYADALLARETPDGLMLLDGHLRRDSTPTSMVPVLILDVTEEEADKILLTLDPLAGMATVDPESLQTLVDLVEWSSEDLAATLKPLWPDARPEFKDLKDPAAHIDKAAEFQAKWRTETGQAWQIGPHRLVCGDCRDEATVARLWADSGPKLRAVWTDPPYGVNYSAKNAYLNRADRGNRIQTPIENDKLTAGETGILFKQALALARQFAEPGAACYATVPSGPLLFHFRQAFSAAGFTLHAQLIWLKNHFAIGMADYHHRYEPILYGWLPDAAHYFVDDRTQVDVFEVDKPQASELHPTQKPVELIARMIANSSRTGELIYDPFCGSGSTILAAHQLGRIGYGCEIDPGYVAVTLERLSALGPKPELVQ
jgi:DNA modification methylase